MTKCTSVAFSSKIVPEKTETKRDRSILRGLYYDIVGEFCSSDKNIILMTKDGESVNALISKPKRDDWYVLSGGDCVGSVVLSRANATVRGNNYPEYYKDKPYLFINSINSSKEYKGVGTQLVRECVRESRRRGFDGRLCLNTTTTKPDFGSPVPFYYKMGFQAADKDKQSMIEAAINNGAPIPASCTAVTMFLPKDVIEKIK
ncbi:MAG: GNAT family N-acetyltransferase [Candidatus Gastranaerophilales bacterium]|nr:GNAT family N-acetyltransferase [Candidatus Gastranaerophilales bacterium]